MKDDATSKRAELQEQIDQGLDELGAALEAGHSEQLVQFLNCLSHFHRYSLGNVLLISWQRPEATQVAGFRTWQKMGRHVRKGERGIRILAPVVRRRASSNVDPSVTAEAADDDQPTIVLKSPVTYRTVHVFDISQTDGKELPEFARVSGDPGEYVARIRQQIQEAGIQLDEDHIPGGADGVSRGGAITIRPGLSPAEECSVLIHELSHEIIHRGPRRHETTKTIRETEAEAVAFTVCRAIGLETGTASSDYIQLYNGSRETLQESLHHIRECAARILDGLLAAPDPVTEPPHNDSIPVPTKQQQLF
ncbi:MAG: ArdC family protein [Planctomycetota bacterium]|nr:ArdC family protein [Planctomycetota bacterium]